MSDWKTAAELRAMAEAATGYDRMVLLHLAAEEEERAKRAERELEAMKRREKVGEWWEVWCETGVVDVYRQRASALRWARGDGDPLVHVTRWRKR